MVSKNLTKDLRILERCPSLMNKNNNKSQLLKADQDLAVTVLWYYSTVNILLQLNNSM